MKSEELMGKEVIWKIMLKMGLPVMMAQLVNLLYNIVDRIYIGYMGEASVYALAGIGIVAPLVNIIAAFAAFVSGGAAPLAAKALGAKDEEKANKFLGNGICMLFTFSLILFLVLFIFKENLLYAIGADSNSYKYANDYLSIYLIGTLFVQLAVGLNTFISAQGKSLLAMLAVLIGALINIALDPLFIFAFNLGIKGAALATVISQMISAIFVIYILYRKNQTLHIQRKYLKFDKKILLATLALGISPFVMSSTESMIGFVLNGQLEKYGSTVYVALLTVFQSVMMLITVPLSGFTNGVTPVISYNYGVGNKERVVKCFKFVLAFCYIYTTTLGAIAMIFPTFFASFFTDEIEVINLSKELLPIFLTGMLIFGIQRACQLTFVALGQATVSLFIALLRKVILLIPLALILPSFFGVNGVIYAEPIADVLAATTCGTLFFFIFKKVLRKMDEAK